MSAVDLPEKHLCAITTKIYLGYLLKTVIKIPIGFISTQQTQRKQDQSAGKNVSHIWKEISSRVSDATDSCPVQEAV